MQAERNQAAILISVCRADHMLSHVVTTQIILCKGSKNILKTIRACAIIPIIGYSALAAHLFPVIIRMTFSRVTPSVFAEDDVLHSKRCPFAA